MVRSLKRVSPAAPNICRISRSGWYAKRVWPDAPAWPGMTAPMIAV